MIPFAQPEYVNCPTGLVLPKDIAEQRYTPRRPVMVELFCGCGGFGLGFIEAGFEVVAASDWDCAAAVTYMVNMCRYGEFTIHYIEDSDQERLEKYLSKLFKKGSCSGGPLAAGTGWISKQPRHVPGTKHFFLGDVRKLTGARILDAIGMKKGEVDCVTGGPPCQGYSRGRQTRRNGPAQQPRVRVRPDDPGDKSQDHGVRERAGHHRYGDSRWRAGGRCSRPHSRGRIVHDHGRVETHHRGADRRRRHPARREGLEVPAQAIRQERPAGQPVR